MVARELTVFWNLKKLMAENAEPPIVTEIVNIIKPYINGYTLAGAGGGGFICILTKNANEIFNIRKILKPFVDNYGVSIHKASVSRLGLVTEIVK